jgi:hypothetical protein
MFYLTRLTYVKSRSKVIGKAVSITVFCEGPRSICYGRTAALRLIVQPCDEDNYISSLFLVMEHRWNETDSGKLKYSGKNL